MNNLKGKRVLIFQQRGWGKGIGRFLAKKLYDEGCVLAALTSKPATHELIVNQSDVKYDLIISHDELMGDPKKFLADGASSLDEICKEIGVDSIWPMASILRQYARSYRDKYFYSFKQNLPDEMIVFYVQALYKEMRRAFDEFKPDLIIAPAFVSTHHIMFNIYGKKKSVPMLAVTDTKVKGFFAFNYGYCEDAGPFHERVDELNNGVISPNSDKAKQYIKEFRELFKDPDYMRYVLPKKTSLKGKIRHEIMPFYLIYRWYKDRPKNPWPAVGIHPDHKPPKYILRDHYMEKYYKWRANKFDYHPFSKVGKFVYFPLQVQPENTIDVSTDSFFSNQIETARLVAQSLPGDYTLVVKDHPAMIGIRPPSYLEKVARTPNIKLVDYRIHNEDILKKADLIVSPGGTTVAEAAIYRKPAIQLGKLGTTLKLPNVLYHTDMPTLHLKIKEMLAKNFNTSDYEIRLENYVAAAYDVGFDDDYVGIWEGSAEGKEVLWGKFYKEILRIFRK